MSVFNITRLPRENKLPVVLIREEVHRVPGNIRVLRHRACLTLIYSCGLRLSEATRLRVNQIDSERMLIHIQQAKSRYDRYVPLPKSTLRLLRTHYKTHWNPVLVFPCLRRAFGRQAAPGGGEAKESAAKKPLPDSSIRTVFKKSLREVGISKDARVHTLRHPSSGRWRGYQNYPGIPRPSIHQHHHDLHPAYHADKTWGLSTHQQPD